MIWNNFEDMLIESTDLKLRKLIESPEWQDICKIIGVFYQMSLEELSVAEGDEVLKGQGRLSVLYELTMQIESKILDLTNVQNARELDEFERNYDEEV